MASIERNGEDALVTGLIVIKATASRLENATAHVTLEDVSFADAPSTSLAEAVVSNVAHDPTAGETTLRFAIGERELIIDPQADYAVRVWIDRDGDGRPGPGDLHSDSSYRVLTHGFSRDLIIVVGSH